MTPTTADVTKERLKKTAAKMTLPLVTATNAATAKIKARTATPKSQKFFYIIILLLRDKQARHKYRAQAKEHKGQNELTQFAGGAILSEGGAPIDQGSHNNPPSDQELVAFNHAKKSNHQGNH